MSWGYHLVLDCREGDMDSITNPYKIKQFSKELVETIEMVPYGEPIIEHFATHDPDKAGWTLVQLIETSNINCHFVDKNGDFYCDIFSCKEFDTDVARDVVTKYFNPKHIKEVFLERDAR